MPSPSERLFSRICVTGGAGYVGSLLVPRLLERGYAVRVLDLGLFGEAPLAPVAAGLDWIRGDLRDPDAVRRSMDGADAVIHLACISNDPSCELDPDLSRSVNFECFEPLVARAREAGVRRFVFASSASIYGVSDAPRVTESHPLRPLTLYNTLKWRCEQLLAKHQSPDFTTVAIRPATLCGRSPRQRLDLTVNLLTAQALERGVITVFGGAQRRPHLHVADMVELYERLLEMPSGRIAGEVFNVARENRSVAEVARLVKEVVEKEFPERGPVEIETSGSDDPRSYHVDSGKIERQLGFRPRRRIEEAVREVAYAIAKGEIARGLDDDRFHNVRWLRALERVARHGARDA